MQVLFDHCSPVLPGAEPESPVHCFLIQRFPIHYIEHAPAHNQLLLTLGVAYIFENVLLVIFTPNYKTLTVKGFEKALRAGYDAVTGLQG